MAGLLPPGDEDAGYVLIPTGAGSNVLGCDIGFGELLRCGEIEAASPALRCSARELRSPLRELCLGRRRLRARGDTSHDREGAAIAKPVRTREVLAAIRRSGDAAISVSEEEIVEAMNDLAESGLCVEPTSASAAAALSGLLWRGVIRPVETTVVVLTGGGLKATQRIGEPMGALPASVRAAARRRAGTVRRADRALVGESTRGVLMGLNLRNR